MLESVSNAVHSGLDADERRRLLTTYEVKGSLATISAPRLNKVILATQGPNFSVLKRDEHQVASQSQVAACLNALGSGLSTLLSLESSLPESAVTAIGQMSHAALLLADLQYRLSLHRRAFIKPILNLLGKTTADTSSIDEWLFGATFAEDIKDAQACEKAGRGLLKSTPAASKAAKHQPLRQLPIKQATSAGNERAPVQKSSQKPRTGARPSRKPSRRSASQSRYHRR
ncbi:hypothetical protein ALC62_05872 [Cyphomyrmex costatus]|uniref:Uncharacterized protein n=1 Tax=Cyphomyrmex costatus TaxID=456900 RepID=A0A151IJA9_9HYME|nr:hypothetical protein ALC62_05872 [Cyphomyrmex costatus]